MNNIKDFIGVAIVVLAVVIAIIWGITDFLSWDITTLRNLNNTIEDLLVLTVILIVFFIILNLISKK